MRIIDGVGIGVGTREPGSGTREELACPTVGAPLWRDGLAGVLRAGIVLGARGPIVLTSRADSARTRLASCAVAALYADAQQRGAALLKAAAE